MGPNGIRAGWRLLIYFAMIVAIVTPIRLTLSYMAKLNPRAAAAAASPGAITIIVSETITFLIVLVPALIMARIEKRSPGGYGIPLGPAFRGHFWLGMLWGLIQVSALVGLIAIFHGYSFGAFALRTGGILLNGFLFLVAFLMVGFFEEFAFRGYTQFTAASGIGFWPAAILLSASFGATHLLNPGEGLVGALSVFAIATFFCLTLKRTGNLWFAIGLHCSFDWGETFLYSVPNSGTTAPGHLSNSIIQGPRWLTGGTIGPEGSVFCFLTIAIMFVLFNYFYPAKRES